MTLASKLGRLLTTTASDGRPAQTAQQLFQEWDLDNSGGIDKEEFRIACRKLGLVGDNTVPEAVWKLKGLSKAEKETCDALFDSLDLDSGGDLDLRELAAGLDNLKALWAKQADQQARVRTELSNMEENVALCERALSATQVFEATQAELTAIVDSPSLETKVGRQFIKLTKDKDIESLLNGWDADGDGQCTLKEAVAGLRAWGVQGGSDAELLTLVTGWDSNGNGILEFAELKVVMELTMDARKKTEQQVRDLKAKVNKDGMQAAARQRAAAKAVQQVQQAEVQ